MSALQAPDVGRRALLQGRPRPRPAPPRPPQALPEPAFLERCTRCDDCLSACPEAVLVRGDGGYPVFDPSLGECTFCDACTTACDAGALDADAARPWDWVAVVGGGCLTVAGVVCQSCRDVCPVPAIAFPPARVPRPQVEAAACTGCGACVAACPTASINLVGEAS
ncbi:MAG: ferredoxin-type protein NapF [Lysobacteraceae bacterium]